MKRLFLAISVGVVGVILLDLGWFLFFYISHQPPDLNEFANFSLFLTAVILMVLIRGAIGDSSWLWSAVLSPSLLGAVIIGVILIPDIEAKVAMAIFGGLVIFSASRLILEFISTFRRRAVCLALGLGQLIIVSALFYGLDYLFKNWPLVT